MDRESRVRRASWRAIALTAAICVCGSCAKDAAAPPNIPLDALYVSLGVSPSGTAMAVGGTQQLTVRPLNPTGATLSGAGLAVFASSDSSRVVVSPTGVLTGLQTTDNGPVLITVSLQLTNITHVDSVYASVTATRQAAASLSIQPADTLASGVTVTVPAVIRDSSGNVLSGIFPYFSVAPNTGVGIGPSSGSVTSSMAQSQWIHASVTAYGVPLQDSVLYTFTRALRAGVVLTMYGTAVSATAGVPEVDSTFIGATGTVYFWNTTGDSTLSIIFDDSTAVTGANLHHLGGSATPYGFAILAFPTAGDYAWHIPGTTPAVTGVVDVH
ncbi:MAG TPA: hypothetical protein VNW46_08875 [Gemmatimonadaceae bacterium]|nr:hypothetical protein [Gemmatimonadaceae bacterium]